MNLKEAYTLLELPTTATPEEAKKKYREFSKKLHPDISKEPDAEAKFKKINEAYDCIKSGKGTDPEPFQGFDFNPFSRAPFSKSRSIKSENIKLNTQISFKESVIGVKKDIKFDRINKCSDCDGEGQVSINNGCSACGGRGQQVTKNGNSIFIQSCQKCFGVSKSDPCTKCNSSGILDTSISLSVSIPGGIINGNILRLSNMGNYVNNFMGMDQYTDVFLEINVLLDDQLSIDGGNVISKLDITLLEALQGSIKKVKTIDGTKEVEVKPLSKNSDEIILPKLGVNRMGNQKVILNVSYPKDIYKIIEVLDSMKE